MSKVAAWYGVSKRIVRDVAQRGAGDVVEARSLQAARCDEEAGSYDQARGLPRGLAVADQ